MRKLLAILLLFSIMLTLPGCGMVSALQDTPMQASVLHAAGFLAPASSSSSDAGMIMGSSALQTNAGRKNAQVVWYGGDGWYVIGYDGTGNSVASRGGVITLLHRGAAETTRFSKDPDRSDANVYSGSTLEKSINSWLYGGSAAKFSSTEQSVIVSRTLYGGSENYGKDGYNSNNVKGPSVNALLWPLSAAEASELPTAIASRNDTVWWLRSPGTEDGRVMAVNGDGSLGSKGSTVDNKRGIRPAFDLDMSAILFTSPAENGKASGSGANALKPTGSKSAGEWKLTLLDDGSVPGLNGHRGFSVDSVATCDGKTLYIRYSGAATGNKEYISAIVRDSTGIIKYYGRIADSNGSGTATLNIDGKVGSSDLLFIFNERYNGDKKTDYSSSLQRISIPSAAGHSWKDATCTDPKTCTVCGLTEGKGLGHNWQDATCTEPKTCTRCGAVKGEALGHDWVMSSCTEPRVCSRCGASEGSAPGHQWKDATCTKPKTCKVCGATEGDPLGHRWQDATCTVPKTCSVCGITEGSAPGHKWKDATCTEPKTCTVCGETQGDPAGHKWIANTCTEPRTCKVCGLTEGVAPGHTWQEATCTKPKTCKVCGLTEGEALGHSWEDATCTKPKTCKVCGATEGKKLGHKPGNTVKENEKAATCEKKGSYDNVVYCTVCGAEISRETKKIKALGHNWDEGKVTTKPTCEEKGVKTYTCKNDSNHIRIEEIKATGHDWDEGKITVKPTCEEKGQKTYTCKTNSNHIKTEEIKPNGHDWGEWNVTIEPGIDKEGQREHTCKVCGKTETEKINPLNSYTVAFDTNGGTSIVSQVIAKGKTAQRPVDPEKEGYTFTGWYADSACRTPFNFSYSISSDIVIYAGWKENEKPAPTVYAVTKGSAGIWKAGSSEPYTIVIKSGNEEDTSFEHYLETLIDGERVQVTAQPGSTVIRIGADVLGNLSTGTHTVKVVFDDGEALALITVADDSQTPDKDSEKDDGIQLSPWLALIPVGLVGILAGFLFGRKSRRR